MADDEPLALALMRSMLERMGGVDVVAECPNGEAVLDAVHEHHPDLLFLDIEMPGLSGFDVVKALQAD
ncbi:MAG: response regulator, partial [Gammaproteobacteria bacterium]|nr:response regulator [Gammaproteobacteria bacterium]